MIVVVLLSLPLGWFALKMREAERQRRAVEAIREAGGHVYYDYQADSSGYGSKPEPPGPAWLRELVGEDLFAKVVRVDSVDHMGSDVLLEHINGFGDLGSVSISGPQVTDAGVEHLKGLALYHVELCDTQVTDTGLKHLKGLTGLVWLDLSGTQVTDDGLEHLKGLTNLERLQLFDTHVTYEGINELQEALPNCKIYWDDPNNNPKDQP